MPQTEVQVIDSGTAEKISPKGIDETKIYRCVIQNGARVSWRGYGSGKAVLIENDGERRIEHRPKLHEVEPISGKTLLGLVARHNKWIDARNNHKLPEGGVARQLIILKHWKTDEPLARKDGGLPESTAALIREIVGATVKEVLESTKK